MVFLSRRLCSAVLLIMSPLFAALALLPCACQAGGPTGYGPWLCPLVDNCTRCGWHRTWHGPNVLAQPLRGYSIPRKAAGCDLYGCTDGCAEAVAGPYANWSEDSHCLESASCCPLDPAVISAGLEHLGQIRSEVASAGGGVDAASMRRGR